MHQSLCVNPADKSDLKMIYPSDPLKMFQQIHQYMTSVPFLWEPRVSYYVEKITTFQSQ